jgi:hypothetical protein
MTNESKTDVVGAGPFAVVNDGVNDFRVDLFARENLEDLGFGEMRVIEDDGKDLRAAFRKQRPRHTAGSAACQSDFLAERKLGKPADESIFGDPF